MANFYKDNDDLQFYVDKWIDWEPLVRITERNFVDPEGHQSLDEAMEFYREILDLVGQFSADEVAPHAEAFDRKKVWLEDGEVVFPPELQGVFDQIKELGLHSMCLPRELGGMNAPLLLYMLTAELFARADVGAMTHHSFHTGMAMAMLVYSIREGSTEFDEQGFITKTRFKDEIQEIMSGEAWGCMDITEPNAGSDMGALTTRAEQDDDGNWFITGQKIYITSGHGKYHFVVARTDDGTKGLDGLSFFLVPTYEDTPEGRERFATIGRVEEKIGHASSATCQIHFEKTPAQLVGSLGYGFRQMLILMNNARVGVAFEGIGISECAVRMARDYAAERGSMGKTIDRHEMIADYLEEMETDIRGMRALTVKACYHEEMAQKLYIAVNHHRGISQDERKEFEKELKYHQREARRLTPLCKYLSSEKACEISRRCIQIHGGAGYTKDYGAEKLLRDALVLPIYEGTSQIQALMSMKDALMWAMKAPQKFVQRIAQTRWRSMSSSDGLERRVASLRYNVYRAQQHLISKTATGKLGEVINKPLGEWKEELTQNWDPKRDFAYAMLHAEKLIIMEADASVAEALLEQAKRFPARRELLTNHLERAESRSRYQLDRILHTGKRLIERLRATEAVSEAAE